MKATCFPWLPPDRGKDMPFEVYVAEVRLLADHSWEVNFSNKNPTLKYGILTILGLP